MDGEVLRLHHPLSIDVSLQWSAAFLDVTLAIMIFNHFQESLTAQKSLSLITVQRLEPGSLTIATPHFQPSLPMLFYWQSTHSRIYGTCRICYQATALFQVSTGRALVSLEHVAFRCPDTHFAFIKSTTLTFAQRVGLRHNAESAKAD